MKKSEHGRRYSEHYCLDCGEPKETKEPNCGCGKSDSKVGAITPTDAEQDIIRHGYDPREHPFVLQQADRIRELETELAEVKQEWLELAKIEAQKSARAERADAELTNLKAELAETSLAAYRHYEKAEKAEAEVERLKSELTEAKKALLDRDFNGTLIIEDSKRDHGGGRDSAVVSGGESQVSVGGQREPDVRPAANTAAHPPACPCGWPIPNWVPRGVSWDCPICSEGRIRALEAELASERSELKGARLEIEDAQYNCRLYLERAEKAEAEAAVKKHVIDDQVLVIKDLQAELERLKAEIREHRCVNDRGEYA